MCTYLLSKPNIAKVHCKDGLVEVGDFLNLKSGEGNHWLFLPANRLTIKAKAPSPVTFAAVPKLSCAK